MLQRCEVISIQPMLVEGWQVGSHRVAIWKKTRHSNPRDLVR